MKIDSLHINTEPTWRGGEAQTLYLLEGLRRRGQAAVLLAAPGSPLLRRAEAAGIEAHALAVRSEADLPAILRVARLLRRRAPDVLHLHTSHAHAIGVLAAVLAGSRARRVVSRRVNFSIYRHSFLGLNWIKYSYGVDRYLAVSRSVRDVLVRDGVDPARVRVVYSGVDPARFAAPGPEARARLLAEWRLPRGVPVVGAIGALVPYKGFAPLLEATAAAARLRPLSLVLVGEGPERGALLEKARRLGIESCVRLAGFRQDVGEVLSAFDVFAFPSLEEGLGTSILEALLLGLPTVASRAGGIPEVIEHERSGLLVEPGNAAALAAALAGLLAEPARARRLAEAGREAVLERFHADAMVENTLQSYRELLEEEGAAARSVRSVDNASRRGAEVAGAR